MKKIEAIVRPESVESLKDALFKAKINGITITQVFGCGNQHGWKEYVRGSEIITNTLPKVEFKIIITDDKLEEIVNLIINAEQSGEVGDGKIFVSNISDCVRIRTGERGNSAI